MAGEVGIVGEGWWSCVDRGFGEGEDLETGAVEGDEVVGDENDFGAEMVRVVQKSSLPETAFAVNSTTCAGATVNPAALRGWRRSRFRSWRSRRRRARLGRCLRLSNRGEKAGSGMWPSAPMRICIATYAEKK